MSEKTIYLETYDPNWEEKFDRAKAKFDALTAKGRLTNAEAIEYRSLSTLMCTICDAGLKTPQEYMERHLKYTIQEADDLGLVIRWPDVPPDASIDTVRAAIAEVVAYVDRAKRDRLIIAERASVLAAALENAPPQKWSWRWRLWAMLPWPGRRDRNDARGSV